MSRKILEYFTVVDTNLKTLDKQVNTFVEQGYEPCSSVYVIPGATIQICQPMIRCEILGTMDLSVDAPL